MNSEFETEDEEMEALQEQQRVRNEIYEVEERFEEAYRSAENIK